MPHEWPAGGWQGGGGQGRETGRPLGAVREGGGAFMQRMGGMAGTAYGAPVPDSVVTGSAGVAGGVGSGGTVMGASSVSGALRRGAL